MNCNPKIKRELSGILAKRFRILRKYEFRCGSCGRGAIHGAVLQIDHIIPLSVGGTWNDDNLIPMCFECNQGKKCAILTEREIKKLKGINEDIENL